MNAVGRELKDAQEMETVRITKPVMLLLNNATMSASNLEFVEEEQNAVASTINLNVFAHPD